MSTRANIASADGLGERRVARPREWEIPFRSSKAVDFLERRSSRSTSHRPGNPRRCAHRLPSRLTEAIAQNNVFVIVRLPSSGRYHAVLVIGAVAAVHIRTDTDRQLSTVERPKNERATVVQRCLLSAVFRLRSSQVASAL